MQLVDLIYIYYYSGIIFNICVATTAVYILSRLVREEIEDKKREKAIHQTLKNK